MMMVAVNGDSGPSKIISDLKAVKIKKKKKDL